MLRRATGAAARTNVTATTRRYMSSEVSLAEEIKEMKKWKVCIGLYRYSEKSAYLVGGNTGETLPCCRCWEFTERCATGFSLSMVELVLERDCYYIAMFADAGHHVCGTALLCRYVGVDLVELHYEWSRSIMLIRVRAIKCIVSFELQSRQRTIFHMEAIMKPNISAIHISTVGYLFLWFCEYLALGLR